MKCTTFWQEKKIFHQLGFSWNKGIWYFPSLATFWGPGTRVFGRELTFEVEKYAIQMDDRRSEILPSDAEEAKVYRWVFPKIMVPPKSSILIGFSIINHPFWGKTPYFWKHPDKSMIYPPWNSQFAPEKLLVGWWNFLLGRGLFWGANLLVLGMLNTC